MSAPVALLVTAYDQVTQAVTGLDATDFLRPTRAEAWCVQDLLFHQMLDAQRALMGFARTTSASPDVGDVTYWEGFRPDLGDGGVAHARFVRIASSAYTAPGQLVAQWTDTAAAAVRAAESADDDARVETQGHVLEAADFVSTLVVEATVHYLDLTLHLTAPAPSDEALRLTRGVLEGLLGSPLPAGWSDVDGILKGTGRTRLTDADQGELDHLAARFPLLG